MLSGDGIGASGLSKKQQKELALKNGYNRTVTAAFTIIDNIPKETLLDNETIARQILNFERAAKQYKKTGALEDAQASAKIAQFFLNFDQ